MLGSVGFWSLPNVKWRCLAGMCGEEMQVICVEMTAETVGVRMEISEAGCLETRSKLGRRLTVSERSNKKS